MLDAVRLMAEKNIGALELMTDKRARHLPAVDRGRLIGLVSIGDPVKTSLGPVT